MITYQRRLEFSTDDGLEISIHLRKMWYLKLIFCKPKSFCLAWRHRMNACDVLFMVALWVFLISAFKYYPFGGNKYKESEIENE